MGLYFSSCGVVEEIARASKVRRCSVFSGVVTEGRIDFRRERGIVFEWPEFRHIETELMVDDEDDFSIRGREGSHAIGFARDFEPI